MKRTLKSFFVSALMVLVCLTLVACGQDIETDVEVTAPFGEKYPENVTAQYKINKSMTALQMYEAGVKNFKAASFVASSQLGNITTNNKLTGDMTQKLDCLKIKEDNRYYLGSSSYTIKGGPAIKMSDQSIYENGKYRVRSANSKDIKVEKDGTMSVSKWPAVEVFESLGQGLQVYPDDPTKINMFIVNSKTLKTSTKPIYDAKNKTYKFNITLDLETATKDYIRVMEYKTKKGGVTPKGINFTKLRLTIVMWENGLIKSIGNEESYIVNALGFENRTSLLATTYFTYDRAEVNTGNYFNQF